VALLCAPASARVSFSAFEPDYWQPWRQLPRNYAFVDRYGRVCLKPEPDFRAYGIHWPNQTGRIFCYLTINAGWDSRRWRRK
jgi:hypothetical protein